MSIKQSVGIKGNTTFISYLKLLVPGLLLSFLERLWHNGQELFDLEPDTGFLWYIICAVHFVYQGHHTGHQWEHVRIPA